MCEKDPDMDHAGGHLRQDGMSLCRTVGYALLKRWGNSAPPIADQKFTVTLPNT